MQKFHLAVVHPHRTVLEAPTEPMPPRTEVRMIMRMETTKASGGSGRAGRLAPRAIVARALVGAVLLLFGLATWFFTPFLLFATDVCPDPTRHVCTEAGQTLVLLLPAIGSPAMMIGGGVGLCLAKHGTFWGLLALAGLCAIWKVNSALIGG
jgi:hypothetical protein